MTPTKSVLHRIVEESPRLAASTRDKYLRDLNAWIKFAGDNPAGWTRRKAQDFYNSMLHRGLRPQSATRLFTSLQYASKWWAHQEGNPALDFALVQIAKSAHKQDRKPLTEDEATRLLLACLPNAGGDPNLVRVENLHSALDLRDFALMVVMLETGMRRMSLMSMQIESTSIIQSGGDSPSTWVLLKGRGTEPTSIPLSDTACRALGPWLAWLSQHRIRTGPVFRTLQRRTGPEGLYHLPMITSVGKTAIANLVAERAKLAGLDHVHPHLFRHTFITWRTNAGYAFHEIAAMTSHKLSGLGALGGYVDLRVLGEKIRNSTPEWLKRLVG